MDKYDGKMLEIANLIRNLKHYDNNYKLGEEIYKWIYELSYFQNTIIKDGEDPSLKPYKIPSSKRPKEGQLAYINLRRGYPKELFDDHWCYILKDLGSKFIVIPSTSIKQDSECDEKYEMDIESKILGKNNRLQFSDIRAIDIMRLSMSKNPNVDDVITDRKIIIDKCKDFLFDEKNIV